MGDPENVHGEHAAYTGENYLNFPFFLLRAAIYFAIWALIVSWSIVVRRYRTSPTPDWLGAKFNIAGRGWCSISGRLTFAAIDWLMSLFPGWPSTIFPLIIIAGQGLLALALGSSWVAFSLITSR